LQSLSPKIIFEDKHIVVLSKPAGLLSQGEKTGDPNLVDWLRDYFGHYYVGLIHRLDRNVSGLMVVAKRTKAASRLSESLRTKDLVRYYLGWVHGDLKGKMVWKHFLVKNEATNEVKVFRHKKPDSKEAMLCAQALASGALHGALLTLVLFNLQTGRSHQIRVQAAFEGHPLLGDVKYLKKAKNVDLCFGRPALHSFLLELTHPMSGERLKFKDDLPEDMKTVKMVAVHEGFGEFMEVAP